MTYDDVLDVVSKSLGLPKDLVSKTYRAYWRAVREHITSLPLKSNLTEEEITSLQPNVNIPSLGKLYVPLDKYKKKKEYYRTKQLNIQ